MTIIVRVWSKNKACTVTVSNALKKLLNKGDIVSPMFGYYKKK